MASRTQQTLLGQIEESDFEKRGDKLREPVLACQGDIRDLMVRNTVPFDIIKMVTYIEEFGLFAIC
jgi:hypothetical protein